MIILRFHRDEDLMDGSPIEYVVLAEGVKNRKKRIARNTECPDMTWMHTK